MRVGGFICASARPPYMKRSDNYPKAFRPASANATCRLMANITAGHVIGNPALAPESYDGE